MSLNKVILMGNLTKDPELKTFDSGKTLCKFNIACNEKYKDNRTGEYVEKVAYINNIQVWGKSAVYCSENLHKGSRVFVDAKIENNDYTDKEGVKHYGYNFTASNVTNLSVQKSGASVPSDSTPSDQSGEEIPF